MVKYQCRECNRTWNIDAKKEVESFVCDKGTHFMQLQPDGSYKVTDVLPFGEEVFTGVALVKDIPVAPMMDHVIWIARNGKRYPGGEGDQEIAESTIYTKAFVKIGNARIRPASFEMVSKEDHDNLL